MADINEVRFSGTIERLQTIKTRTGVSMARWLLRVGQDRFRCVAFKNVADAVLRLHDGDRISVSGTGAINSWKDDAGHWHNDFQCTAWAVEIGEEKITYQKQAGRKQDQPGPRQSGGREDLSMYDYTAGPF